MEEIEYLCPFLKEYCSKNCMFSKPEDYWDSENLYKNCVISDSLVTIAEAFSKKSD